MDPSYSESANKPIVREASTYLNDAEAASVCTMFGDGLESGMSYARIVDMLERQGYDKKVINRLRHSLLEEGDMLGESFARYGMLDATSRKLVYVAEQQGKLPRTFKNLAINYEKRHKRRRRFALSFVEPGLLVILGLILARNIFTSDLIAVTENFSFLDIIIPVLIKSGIESLIFALVSFFFGYVYLNLPVDMGLRNSIQRFWTSLPLGFINESSRLSSVSIFCRYTEQSISSGLTVHRALALAAEASNNPKFEARIPIAQKAIEQGRGLAAALYEADALPSEVLEYIDIGEEAGRLEERLRELSNRYEDRANEAFENAMKAFVYGVRMLIIVIVIVLLFLAIFGFMDGGFDLG